MTLHRFFLAGVPKSGTTWLGKLLDAHPMIACKGEACMYAFVKSLIGISNEYNALLEGRTGHVSDSNEFPPLPEKDVYEIARYFMELRLSTVQQSKQPSPSWVGEKDPLHVSNFILIARLFPEAKVIHLIRDGRSVVTSAWHHNIRTRSPAVEAGFDSFLNEAASRWGAIIKRARETATALGDNYFEVRYEDLVGNAVQTLDSVLRFLGPNSSQRTILDCLESASFEKLSAGRARGVEDNNSFFRKGTADDWKTQMTPSQVQRFNARSGGMLEELGYLAES